MMPLPDSSDTTPCPNSPSKETVLASSTAGTTTADVTTPEIIISAVDSEDGVGTTSTNTTKGSSSRDDHDEDKCKFSIFRILPQPSFLSYDPLILVASGAVCLTKILDMDPNDKANGGDVVQYFFTSSTRKRPHSPVTTEPGCCNPQLHQDSDLYIKARDKDGHSYVFEVVSTVLEKASHKFEKMVYGTHVRGNQEEWVWELSDNP